MEIKVLASGSKGNCYHISDGHTSLLLDAGIPLKKIQIGCEFKLNEIAGALISHRHNDHSRAVRDLAGRGIDIYASPDVFIFAGICFNHRAIAVEPFKTTVIGTFCVIPFEVEHDVPNFGYLLYSSMTGERLLFFTDTMYVKYRFPDCTHIMAECNYSDEAIEESVRNGCIPPELVPRIVKSHMSLEHFLSMLAANDLTKLKQVYLLHLSENNARRNEFKEAVQRATGAEVYVC